MKKTFSWENFDTEFLTNILTSTKTRPENRLRKKAASKLLLSAYMSRICAEPDYSFVRRYREEIDAYILSDTETLEYMCSYLQDKNFAGIKCGSNSDMRESIMRLSMNRSLGILYLNILKKIGYKIDSDCDGFYSTPKNIDLTTSVPNDIHLEDYQRDAVNCLDEFYNKKFNNSGIIVMPTGSGKTRTAVYFLLKNILSKGYQVVWLAHRSMLLEQTADTFYKNSALIKYADPSRERLKILCVSGEHCRIKYARKDTDIIIGSVQSLSRNLDYIPSVIRDKVMIIVDEAHHTTAKTYRRVIDKIRGISHNTKLLGLTATPVRTIEKETYQLMKLYDDSIIYSISMGELVKRGVLSVPEFETVMTDFDIEAHIDIDEEKYIRKWGELSPGLVEFLAGVCERNELIVNTYIRNKERYGKTIIFAMNAHHCISLCDAFVKRGIKCDYIYSMADNNADKIARFRRGEIDVLVNINMLTEGSDIADIQTVFLTRPTQSDVLLMQMIGRGMRGKSFGGTENVNIVDFCDKWDMFNKWLNPEFVFGQDSPYTDTQYKHKKAIIYPWKMFADIIKSISYTYGGEEETLVSLPVGWYDIEDNGVQTSVIVFENQLDGYKKITDDYIKICSESMTAPQALNKYFNTFCLLPSENDVRLVINEIKRTEKPPTLHMFEERSEVDAALIAERLKERNASAAETEKEIERVSLQYPEIVESVYSGKSKLRRLVYNYLLDSSAPPVGSIIMEFPDEQLPYVPGPAYDLQEFLSEVINEMFGGRFENIPKISWTDKPMKSYFGLYNADYNFILINKLLDSASVPKEVVKYIIYHELLHTKIMAHNAEFRSLEHEYPSFSDYEYFLDFTFSHFDFNMEYAM